MVGQNKKNRRAVRYCWSSYLYSLDYLYWRVYRFRNADIGKYYWEYLSNCYSNQDVWEIHKEELLDIVSYTKDNNIQLVLVLFPHLVKMQQSKEFISKVAGLMNVNEVETIDLSTEFAARDPKELVVNSFDVHPNEATHKEIGGLLYDRIRRE